MMVNESPSVFKPRTEYLCDRVLSLTVAANTAPHEIDCKGAPDGLFEIGCWGYANCLNEVPEIHACPTGTVLERHDMKCIVPGTGQTECFAPVTCVGKADASYPDYGDKCVTYYRCQGGLLLGRFYCPTPTAFNEDLGICDYPRNLRSPCGPLPARKTTPMPTTTMPTTTMPTTTTTAMPITGDSTMPTSALPTTTTGSVATSQTATMVHASATSNTTSDAGPGNNVAPVVG
ncbi:hypothetical protein ElyMa_004175400 [Elysia marginata]|uniref:Chitin-binding type-2 domain-containing protein n=1 Tax=Elysia marginata TaxID=1093978 RepID=A0AAV4GKM1_9GAST|nr:hypothetical protein ElyMa_004175400 [Elysia marginata]